MFKYYEGIQGRLEEKPFPDRLDVLGEDDGLDRLGLRGIARLGDESLCDCEIYKADNWWLFQISDGDGPLAIIEVKDFATYFSLLERLGNISKLAEVEEE